MTAKRYQVTSRQGSLWHRWDPHIHAPGTILNNQFGPDAWKSYLERISAIDPPIRALGITDYYDLGTYEVARAAWERGDLPGVALLFPNVELRLDIGTGRGKPVNVHLLVCPDQPDHVEQTRRHLRQLTFHAHDQRFTCDHADLTRLGRLTDQSITNDQKALAKGAEQFKVSLADLKSLFSQNMWMHDNVLIAVAAGSSDGTSGLKNDDSMATLRGEIERISHIIFSGQPKQREFWLGRGSDSADQIRRRMGGLKPCLHGSDAHQLDRVGQPDENRRCWLKGDLTFETLRQACLEPEERVFIGEEPPIAPRRSYVIDNVTLIGAPWAATSEIPLNPGLVAIVGARGSGKTALADIIAAGSHAIAQHISPRSFLARAQPLLRDGLAMVEWEDHDITEARLAEAVSVETDEGPRVQYLSQQFVETLCSAEGMTDALLEEVERVVFEAHPYEDRLGTTDFQALLSVRAMRPRSKRQQSQQALAATTSEIAMERELQAMLPSLQRRRGELAAVIAKDEGDRIAVISRGATERAARYQAVAARVEARRGQINELKRRHQSLIALQDEATEMQVRRASADLLQLRGRYANAGLSDAQWQSFRMDYVGDVQAVLDQSIGVVLAEIGRLEGPPQPPLPDPVPENSLLPDNIDQDSLPLSLLDREAARLRALIGLDAARAQELRRLTEKIERQRVALTALDVDIAKAQGADERMRVAATERSRNYERVFEALIEEQHELQALYSPMKSRLEGEKGALAKLSFSVRRLADVQTWALRGEAELDLRKAGKFRGHGSLQQIAEDYLRSAWETGTAEQVAHAMRQFVDQFTQTIFDHAPVAQSDINEFRAWQSRVGAWLYSTDHVRISYQIEYDEVAIEQLSPGTRGIVLLLLYLALDRDDVRPLIIDQPEENLDPKSVNDELVERFRRGRGRRQVIMITHNANLVVNADVDQVIVASAGPHVVGQLPSISYRSGGLEDPDIRREVCGILEGGEAAFLERARRLRVKM